MDDIDIGYALARESSKAKIEVLTNQLEALMTALGLPPDTSPEDALDTARLAASALHRMTQFPHCNGCRHWDGDSDCTLFQQAAGRWDYCKDHSPIIQEVSNEM